MSTWNRQLVWTFGPAFAVLIVAKAALWTYALWMSSYGQPEQRTVDAWIAIFIVSCLIIGAGATLHVRLHRNV